MEQPLALTALPSPSNLSKEPTVSHVEVAPTSNSTGSLIWLPLSPSVEVGPATRSHNAIASPPLPEAMPEQPPPATMADVNPPEQEAMAEICIAEASGATTTTRATEPLTTPTSSVAEVSSPDDADAAADTAVVKTPSPSTPKKTPPASSSSSSSSSNSNSTTTATTDKAVPAPPRPIPMREVARHNHARDCWVVIGGDVYDCTDFAARHPGGAKSELTTSVAFPFYISLLCI